MKKKIKIWKLAVGICAAVLGLFMLRGAITTMPETDKWWKENSLPAKGTVIELRETFRNKAWCYYPVITFKDVSGTMYTFTPDMCYSKGSYSPGSHVAVRYKKDNPSVAYIDSPSGDRDTIIIVYVMSGLILITGIAFIVSGVKGSAA